MKTNQQATIINLDKCKVCGKLRFEHPQYTLCQQASSTLRKIHSEIQHALAEARKTREYKEEGEELNSSNS